MVTRGPGTYIQQCHNTSITPCLRCVLMVHPLGMPTRQGQDPGWVGGWMVVASPDSVSRRFPGQTSLTG